MNLSLSMEETSNINSIKRCRAESILDGFADESFERPRKRPAQDTSMSLDLTDHSKSMIECDKLCGNVSRESIGLLGGRTLSSPRSLQHHIDFRAILPERYEANVKEDYDIESLLGKGGFGKVVLARDKHFGGRVVAIKKISKRSAKHTEACHQEAFVMRQLDHPNICRLFEFFEDHCHVCFVMELCAGGHLLARIENEGRINEHLSADILGQASKALRYAHDRHIAHRDLKPDNICFSSSSPDDMQIKIIDWGLSIAFHDKHMSSICGTVFYAAPEILSLWNVQRGKRDPYGCSCDVWSLGVIAFFMLSGQRPFSGDREQLLRKAQNAEYVMGDDWNNVSELAKGFVRTVLQPDPDKRPDMVHVASHRWLCDTPVLKPAEPTICAEVLQNMKLFSQLSHFRSLCVTLVAHQLDHAHVQDLAKLFQKLDTGGEGVLTIQEVRDGFTKILGTSDISTSQFDDIFKAADLDGSGTIDYTEFIAAGLSSRVSMQDEALWAAFRSLDRDATGSLSPSALKELLSQVDIRQSLSARTCDAVINQVVAKCDFNSDGKIDFDEFRTFMNASGPQDASPGDERINIQDIVACGSSIATPDCLKSPVDSE